MRRLTAALAIWAVLSSKGAATEALDAVAVAGARGEAEVAVDSVLAVVVAADFFNEAWDSLYVRS